MASLVFTEVRRTRDLGNVDHATAGWNGSGPDGNHGNVATLVYVDFAMPLMPGFGGREHAAGTCCLRQPGQHGGCHS